MNGNICHTPRQLLAYAKQAIVLLFLLGFAAQLNGEFFASALSFIQKKAVEQVADDLNLETESDGGDDIFSPKKSKWVKKTFPPDFPFDISYITVAVSNNYVNQFNRAKSSGNVCLHRPFPKTPRYIAFHSLIFYEL